MARESVAHESECGIFDLRVYNETGNKFAAAVYHRATQQECYGTFGHSTQLDALINVSKWANGAGSHEYWDVYPRLCAYYKPNGYSVNNSARSDNYSDAYFEITNSGHIITYVSMEKARILTASVVVIC